MKLVVSERFLNNQTSKQHGKECYWSEAPWRWRGPIPWYNWHNG